MLYKYMLAENLKHKHSILKKLMLILPLVTVLLSFVLMQSYFTINAFNWWYAMIMPVTFALIPGLMHRKKVKVSSNLFASRKFNEGVDCEGFNSAFVHCGCCFGSSICSLYSSICSRKTTYIKLCIHYFVQCKCAACDYLSMANSILLFLGEKTGVYCWCSK